MNVNSIIEAQPSNPLISIVIITYNSSKYVLETLESAKAQTYQNIELIVSDDCSTDDTIEICTEWIKENRERFVRTEVISAKKNTGIPSNVNRGYYASKGAWIKSIAGDDILLSNCIQDNIRHIENNINTKILCSFMLCFTEDNSHKAILPNIENQFFHPEVTAEKQFKLLLQSNPVPAPSVFMSKELFQINEGFDESIRFMEDYPFWIKTTQKNIKIDFLPKITVLYRLHNSSISSYSESKLFNDFYLTDYNYRKENLFKYMSSLDKLSYIYSFVIMTIFQKLKINKKNYQTLYKLFIKLNIFYRLKLFANKFDNRD